MKKFLILFVISFVLVITAGKAERRALFLDESVYEEYENGNIDTIVRSINNQGWNEVFIPVYNGSKAFWPSTAFKNSGGSVLSEEDTLRPIIQAFSDKNLRVGAWFKGGLRVDETDHPLYLQNPGWFSRTSNGKADPGGTLYLSPASEAAMSMIKQMIYELMSNYPFSSISIDNFTWGSYNLGFENQVLEKYRAAYHLAPQKTVNFQSDQWETFRRNLLNMRLKEIYRLIKAINPYIHVSGMSSTPLEAFSELQPWKRWFLGGYVDSLIVKLGTAETEHVEEEIRHNLEYAGAFKNRIYFSHPWNEKPYHNHSVVFLTDTENIQEIPALWEEKAVHPYEHSGLKRIIITADRSSNLLLAGQWNEEFHQRSLSNRFYCAAHEPNSVYNWITSIPKEGMYSVDVYIPDYQDRCSQVQYQISHAEGTEIIAVDQTQVRGDWLNIGQWKFSERDRNILITINNTKTPEGKHVLADAIRLEYVPVEPEVRAAWSSRYQWTARTVEESKQNIRRQMRRLKEHNFNAVAFQVRPCMETYFPNPYEPFCGEFWNYKSPGTDPETGKDFDAMEYAVTQARLNGLKFYCYINTHTITVRPLQNEVTPPHRFHKHAYGEPEEDWRLYRSEDEPIDTLSSYIWLCPGVPGGEAWTRKMVRYIVDNYEIDGVHFDRIRTPGSEYTYNPISQKRFADPDANPDQFEDMGDFMRKQITDQLERIMGDINLIDPTMEVSNAPFGIVYTEPGFYEGTGTQSHYQWFQASYEWLKRGVVDEIFPQIYWDIESAHPFEVLYAQWLHHSHGRHILAGINNRWDEVAQIKEVRRQNGHGNILWHCNNADYSRIKEEVYQQPAPVPSLPWKVFPDTGMITGTVFDQDGRPLQDAVIQISGDDYHFVTGADGRFSIVNKSPKSYRVSANKRNYTGKRKILDVNAGQVNNITLILEINKE